MLRIGLITSLLFHLVFLGPAASDASIASVVSYPASEVASAARETAGSVDEERLAWCEDVVARTFAVLPEAHVEAVQTLVLSFEEDIRRGQAGGHTMILRCVDVDEAELAAVIVHEMGHIVDTGYLNGSSSGNETSFDDRGHTVYDDDPSVQLYSVSWEDNRSFTSKASGFVSGYAMSNPYEDFAETYALYVLHGPLFRFYTYHNRDLKEKYAFMHDTVFEGVEYDFASEKLPKITEVNQRVYDTTRMDFDLESFWALKGLL